MQRFARHRQRSDAVGRSCENWRRNGRETNTLLGTYIFHLGKKEIHLQKWLGRGYVSSQALSFLLSWVVLMSQIQLRARQDATTRSLNTWKSVELGSDFKDVSYLHVRRSPTWLKTATSDRSQTLRRFTQCIHKLSQLHLDSVYALFNCVWFVNVTYIWDLVNHQLGSANGRNIPFWSFTW